MRRAAPAALAALLALPLAGCDKIEFLPDNPVAPITPKVMLHRGSGQLTDPPPNTLEAMLYGASLLDGAEMDLEISRDGTLWLGHDNEIKECDGVTIGPCFEALTDAEIEQRADCGDGVRRYDRLDVVLPGLKAVYPDKVFSFDIKGQYCVEPGTDGARDLAVKMADEVDRLVRASGFDWRVMSEAEKDPVRERHYFTERLIELGSPVYTFVVSLGDIDLPLSQAVSIGATGISFKYSPDSEPLTASVVAGIHQKGQRIAVWIVNGEADAQAVWAMQPDVIQTDEGNFFSYIPDLPPPLP